MLLVWTRCWPNSWVADATAMMGCHFVCYTGTAVLLVYYTAYWYTFASENCQQVSWCILSWTTPHKRLLLWDNLPNVMVSSWLLEQPEPGAFISLSCCQTSLDLIRRQPINLIPAIMLYAYLPTLTILAYNMRDLDSFYDLPPWSVYCTISAKYSR